MSPPPRRGGPPTPPRARAAALAALLAAALLAAAPPARAASVLPPTAQGKLLKALKPYAPGRPVDDAWGITHVSLAQATVRIDLVGPAGAAGALVLTPRADGPGAFAETASFAVALEPAAGRPPGLEAAARAVAEALRAGDRGDLYVTLDDAPRGDPEEAPGAAPSATASGRLAPQPRGPWDVRWTLLGLGALALLLLLLDRRAPRALPGPPAPRLLDVGAAAALFALAFALRELLGPASFLHENSHGPMRWEEIAGLLPAPRPMGAQTALQQLAGLVSERTPETIARTTAAVASLQAAFAWLAARALGLRPLAALVPGLLVATLPVLVRLSSSEDAFPPGAAFLVAAAAVLVTAVRARSGPWLVAGMLLVAVAGHFRPVMYTAAAPLGLALLLLGERGSARAWLRTPWPWVAALGLFAGAADDLPAILESLGRSAPMTPGWWRGIGLRSWPLADPDATPVWLAVAVPAGAALGLAVRATRRAAAWLLVAAAWLTFVYTSDNGWPASLRYSHAYAWVLALLVGVGVEALARRAGPRPAAVVAGGLAALALAAPFAYAGFIGHRFAQQEEIAFQEREVVPALQASAPGVVITPWTHLDDMSGTLLTVPVRAAGHRVAPPDRLEAALGDVPADTPVFWYRGLACWAWPLSDPRPEEHPVCRAVATSWTWEPVAEADLDPASDADWIALGDQEQPVRVGLYRLVRPGR